MEYRTIIDRIVRAALFAVCAFGLTTQVAAQQPVVGSTESALTFQPSVITTIAGAGTIPSLTATGDGGPATSANVTAGMKGIAVDASDDVFFIDNVSFSVRVVYEGGATAAALIKHKGAKKILACVSHAILNTMGVERLRKSPIDELVTTDTVLRPAISGVKIVTLSVAGLLGEAIKRIHSNSSVTSLFEFKGGRTS